MIILVINNLSFTQYILHSHLPQKDITRKWTIPIPNWGIMLAQFSIMFPKRIKID